MGNKKLDGFHGLRLKERIVLHALKRGLSNKEIARAYDLNLSTVKYYLQNIYSKLGVKNRIQAALIADEIII